MLWANGYHSDPRTSVLPFNHFLAIWCR